MALAPGTILGQYEIRSPLGAGGMGEVYRAHDTRLDREVAIKVLPESLTSDPDRLRRFEQEARAAAALNHPNILAVYQMATHDGVSYMVTELLDGETLRERLRRGPVPLRKAIDYAVQIAHGLAAAHDKGITHRDLKPENLFVTKDGRVKILDFGLAKVGPSKDSSGLEATQSIGTEPGMVMGTVGYMSPEQVRGKTADHRSDIFAFGTILYEMVTGKQTFRKPTSAETMTAILNEEPPSISQIAPASPPGLQRVVHRCLEKSPEQRFQSASDMAFALDALSDSTVTTSTGSHAPVGTGWTRRQKLFAGITGITVLALGGLAYLLLRPEPAPKVSNYVQLTHDGKYKFLVGTEGSRLYYAVASPEYQGMEEMSTSGGEPKKLPNLAPPGFYPLSLSPDGSALLAVEEQAGVGNGQIWSLPLFGGSPRRLGDAIGRGAALSPDGKWLAYANRSELFLAKADGTDIRKLVTMGDPAVIYETVWSPDQRHLEFDVVDTLGGRSLIWEVSFDGTGLHQLLPGWTHKPDQECCGTWTADGRYFVFRSRRQIWALPRKSGFLPIQPKPVQLTFSPLSMGSPMPSADGRKLFVVGRTYSGEAMRYDAKAGQFVPFLGGISADGFSFSKDGQWVAYVTYPDGVLWRSKVDGSERLQLTYPPSGLFPPGYALNPHWSPDGKRVIFREIQTDSTTKTLEVSADGTSLHVLLPADQVSQRESLSPDGTKIALSGEANHPEATIHILDVATHKIDELPGSKGMVGATWSPDGRHMVAVSADLARLLLFDFHTGKWTELVKAQPAGWEFSPDGQYLQYLDKTGSGCVWKIRLSDGNKEKVVDLQNFIGTGYYGFAQLSVAPDGSPLLLRDTGTQDIYSLDWEEP